MESNCTNPIKTRYICVSCNREKGGFAVLPPPPYNFETTHGNVTKITQLHKFSSYWHNDIIWRYYDVILLNFLTESKFRQSPQSEKCLNSKVSDKIKKMTNIHTQTFSNSKDVTMTSFLLKNDLQWSGKNSAI